MACAASATAAVTLGMGCIGGRGSPIGEAALAGAGATYIPFAISMAGSLYGIMMETIRLTERGCGASRQRKFDV